MQDTTCRKASPSAPFLLWEKGLADLTNTMLGDVATTEQMFSHYVPQYYASIISTCLIAISLFFYDWRLALAALWVLPVALAIVGTSKKAQKLFQPKTKYGANRCAGRRAGMP